MAHDSLGALMIQVQGDFAENVEALSRIPEQETGPSEFAITSLQPNPHSALLLFAGIRPAAMLRLDCELGRRPDKYSPCIEVS